MEQVSGWGTLLGERALTSLHEVVAYLPNLGGALLLLLVGWLVARFLRAGTVRLVSGFDRLSSRLGTGLHTVDLVATARISGQLVFWLAVLLFATLAINVLGLTMFSGWLDRLVFYLPNIISGMVIIFAGIGLGRLAHGAVSAAAIGVPERQRALVAITVQYLIIGALSLIGISQIGIDISAIIIVLSVVIAAILSGLAIAFSLGARALVSNLIGVRYLSPEYRVGETIRVGTIEGSILDITAVAVVIDTADGRTTVPAQLFAEQPSILLKKAAQNV